MPIEFLKRNTTPEGPIEAGQTIGMKPEAVLEKYLRNRNSVLRLLRIYFNIPASNVAKRLDITEEELKAIEESNDLVPFQLVPRFSEIFKVDLKRLLILLGHAKGEVDDDNNREFSKLKLAAQYSGPELTRHEKMDLEELFNIILAKVDRKKDPTNK